MAFSLKADLEEFTICCSVCLLRKYAGTPDGAASQQLHVRDMEVSNVKGITNDLLHTPPVHREDMPINGKACSILERENLELSTGGKIGPHELTESNFDRCIYNGYLSD